MKSMESVRPLWSWHRWTGRYPRFPVFSRLV